MENHHKTQKKTEETNANANPIENLTEEIIITILDNLNDHPFAQKSFSLTCKSFYAIESRHRKSLKPLCIELLSRLFNRYPFITNLDLSSLCPRVDDATLIALSRTWKSTLMSINLSRSKFITSSGLSTLFGNCIGLTEIDFSNWTELTDATAATVAKAKNLERLCLARCKLVTDMGIGCIAVGCRKLRFVCLKWCLRVGDLGVELVALKCKEIRSLDLSYLPITEKCLSPILQLPHLEDLILEGCLGIDDGGLETLNHNAKSLKTLDLSNCQNISHVGLSSLINGAECLQQVNLSYGSAVSLQPRKVTADLAACLRRFSNLNSLKLDGCVVTVSGMKSIANWSASLNELSLSKCAGVKDEALSFLVRAHKDLRKLDITCCRKITCVSVDSVTSSCSFLTCLKMESCNLVPKEGFVLIGERCRHLEELDVTDNEIDDNGLKSFSRCSRLSSLKLGICANISDDGLAYVAKGCSKLKELDLYRSSGITDIGISSVARGCPELEMINIAYNDRVTDTSLISLSKCLRLQVLEIRGCPSVSSVGLSAIATGCRQLTLVDIKKCVNINDNGMFALAKFSHNLKQINLSYCSVTDVGLVALATINRLQNMTILHLTGLSPNGLATALLSCRALTKVKLHTSFKLLLPYSLLDYMEARGCVFHWRDKAFQADMDPKGWKLHFRKEPRV